ncbi:MAG: response regulator transcription factor [Candidatus Symbiothrix sp.]|jgi:DNA-binding NarL/FixJ family response regulator|nr:response regulator transcription factor [Candidatus Symbiothrix sp.]
MAEILNHPSVIMADNQDITAAGMMYILQGYWGKLPVEEAKNKRALIAALFRSSTALVVLDYALFDFTRVEELLILQNRFPKSHFLLVSESLTDAFVKYVCHSSKSFSILLKDSSKSEVEDALEAISIGERYVIQRLTNHLETKPVTLTEDDKLTATEREILRLIAMGKSAKEIAAERFLSVHTVFTHKKNIFRKLAVNNLHEATKYALRAGIMDASDYYI